MYKITRFNETMTSRERVRNTFAYQPTDRVPVNYLSNPTVNKKIMEAMGLAGDEQGFLEALGVDYRCAFVRYVGPLIYKEIPGLNVDKLTGFYTKWVPNEFGGYNDFCNFPLKDASDEEIAAHKFPSPDDFDYDSALNAIKSYDKTHEYAIYCGHASIGDMINSTGFIMGMEDSFVGIATENPAVLDLIDRKHAMDFGIMERILDKTKGRIDFLWLGEDLGTQHSPLISADLYQRVFRPRHQKFVDLAKSHNIPVMIHTCGASSWVYEDLIEMGMTAVDTLQPEAAGMSPEELVKNFGGRLSFHGCISTAGPLAYGTADETAEYCKRTLDIMKANGGYHFSPTHAIQDNTPIENLVAMYQAAHDFGRCM